MTFRIRALAPEPFAGLFSLTDRELAARNACRMTATAKPGTPCRVSLEDAEPGETVLLVNYCHLPEETPYRASHAIFVREGVAEARPEPGEIPQLFLHRMLSVRSFDDRHMMAGAALAGGRDLAPAITEAFGDARIRYLHLHYAGPGCFAASVERA
ncbi:DUF1203 domain-containing protein [Poseidonocella sp. HB161398]|uniref:DUF1203 domain-containing protein n=1 Tax=Poseidonocella sp. HB161398 TaxID=2320855 RepID=UPI0011089FF1|nr:DUF1203 domain-containing protein [Poseidonocella sp. HB161398]